MEISRSTCHVGGQQAIQGNVLSEPRLFASTPVKIPQY